MQTVSAVRFARWVDAAALPEAGPGFIVDAPGLPDSLDGLIVVTDSRDEAHIGQLLARGAQYVLVGELALLDGLAFERLLAELGSARLGVWVRAVRNEIIWSLADEAPNAGFKCMQPSMGLPGWDILRADGSTTGTDAEWWIGEMLGKGIAMALICIDMQDEDMNICATLMLKHGAALWFSPLHQPEVDLEPWVRWGKVRQLVLPVGDARDTAELARIAASTVVEDGQEAGKGNQMAPDVTLS